MMKYFFFFLLLSIGFVVEAKPKIEAGLALGGQYIADYRGSSEYRFKAIPLPIFLYHGERVHIDRRGIRGDLLASKAWELNVSAEVALSGADEDNQARRGMPEIDPSVELGPSFNIALDGNILDDGWLLRLPLRSVFTVSSQGIEPIGYVFNPKVTYVHDNKKNGWRFSTSLGVTYASEKYHDYYYAVEAQYVLPDRSEYDAKAGFSGYYFKTSVGRKSGDWRYGMSLRYDNLSNTDFSENSPLVERDDYVAVSFLLARYFWVL